jgi:glutamate dehydrogenase/leucine dehydrogenase
LTLVTKLTDTYATPFLQQRPWGVTNLHFAIPCATQNELDKFDAKVLARRGCRLVIEGANMPTTRDAISALREANVAFVPGTAANAGGVAVSGLEMSQNAQRLQWTLKEVDTRLRSIMASIHGVVVAAADDAACWTSPNDELVYVSLRATHSGSDSDGDGGSGKGVGGDDGGVQVKILPCPMPVACSLRHSSTLKVVGADANAETQFDETVAAAAAAATATLTSSTTEEAMVALEKAGSVGDATTTGAVATTLVTAATLASSDGQHRGLRLAADIDYERGANVAAFKRVADAMLRQGFSI